VTATDEFQGMWKKAVMFYYKMMSQLFSEGTEENHKNPGHCLWSPGSCLNLGPPKYEAGRLMT